MTYKRAVGLTKIFMVAWAFFAVRFAILAVEWLMDGDWVFGLIAVLMSIYMTIAVIRADVVLKESK